MDIGGPWGGVCRATTLWNLLSRRCGDSAGSTGEAVRAHKEAKAMVLITPANKKRRRRSVRVIWILTKSTLRGVVFSVVVSFEKVNYTV
jgi:hypothetical protein